MKFVARLGLIGCFMVGVPALAQQNHQFITNAVYSLNCNDPNAYAFVLRRASDVYLKFAFDKGTLAGAGVINDIGMDMQGASFQINSTSPALFEKFRFSEGRAKLLTMTQGTTSLVVDERFVSNNQESPSYLICANDTPLMTQTVAPNIGQTAVNAEDMAKVKQQLRIERTAIKYSPELRVELDKNRAEAGKAKREADERQALEKQRMDDERAKKEAEAAAAQRAIMAKIKVNGVSLGKNNKLPCQAKASTYENTITGKPVRILFTCDYGVAGDHNELVFASDKKTVVRITRKQFLTDADPHARDVVEKAVQFYGQANKVDMANWLAVYGDAFTVSYNGRRGMPRQGNSGIGLSVKGELCDEYSQCPPKYKYVVKHTLINVDAYFEAEKEGDERLVDQSKSKLNSIKF
jgi:hypothetical protein